MLTLPIRIREVIRPDGTRVRTLFVFCPREDTSVQPERCARCGFRCPPADVGLAPAVGCEVELPEGEAPSEASDGLVFGHHAIAARVSAGAASTQIVVCLEADTPLCVASGVVDPGRWTAVPVVDDKGTLLGAVPGAMLTRSSQEPRERFISAVEAMRPVRSVRDSDHLDEVISIMTAHHLRCVPIVDVAHRVTGVLSDLELLRWVARGAPVRWR